MGSKLTEQQLSTLMSNLPGMTYRCLNEVKCPMFFVSGGCQELTGYSSEKITSRDKVEYGEIIHPDDVKKVSHDIQPEAKILVLPM